MIFTDPERNVIRWSKGAEHILGWSEAEAIDTNEIDLIFTPEDQAAGIPQQEPDIGRREGRAEDNRWHMKKDGAGFWAVGVVTPLYDRDTGELRGFGKVLLDQTKTKRLEEELQQLNGTLEVRVADRTQALEERTAELEAALAERQSLLRRVVTAEERERRRISRELHDQTGQHPVAARSISNPSLVREPRSYCDCRSHKIRETVSDLPGVAIVARAPPAKAVSPARDRTRGP